jgi:hypothetical protein
MRGDGQNQLQISAPLPLKEIYQMIALSAQPMSLDSPFNIQTVGLIGGWSGHRYRMV